MMTEPAQTTTITSVTFDNLVLKQWLHSIGSVRRCELLKKLKADLQDLGLPRRLVHRGLIQLATKPRVVLTREATARQYESRLFVDENEDKSSEVTVNCTTDVEVGECQLQLSLEHIPESITMGIVAEEKYKQNEKVNGIRSYETVSKNCSQTFEANTQPTLQSFDKALEQLDIIKSTKRNAIEKLMSKKISASSDTIMKTEDNVQNRSSSKLCNKAKNLGTCIHNETLLNNTLPQNKKNPTEENLSSSSNETNADIKTDYKSSNVTHSTQKNVRSKSASNIVSHTQEDSTSCTDVEIRNASRSRQKRKSLDTISKDFIGKKKMIPLQSDISESIDKRKLKKLNQFRKYFGDCLSVSEDEQEETILHKNYKKKKDMISSCDSEVYFSDGSVNVNFEEKSKQAQSVPDSTMQEEFKDTSNENLVQANKTDTPQGEDDRNETVTSASETENIITSRSTNIIKSRPNNSEARIAKANTPFDTDKTTFTEKAKGILQRIEASEADSSSIDTEIRGVAKVSCTFETEHGEYDIQNLLTTDISDIQEDNLNNDFNELLRMTFDNTYQIKLNGNVLSIEENFTTDINQNTVKDDTNLPVVETSNLKILAERKLNSKRDQENDDIPLRETVIAINSRMTIKTENELVNDTVCSMLDNVSETASQKSQLERIVNEEKSQSNQGSQGRLRVLSSAELGSRWCPTPMPSITSGTDVPTNNSSNNDIITPVSLPIPVLVSQAVPTASKNLSEPVTITPASLSQIVPITYASEFITPVAESTVPLTNATESYLDSESVNKSLVMICNLIKSIRFSSLVSASTYDNMLYSEFDKLRKRLRPVNFPTLLHGIIKLINKKEFVKEPVTLHQIFCYTPSLQNLYAGISSSQVCNVNDLRCKMCYTNGVATAKNKMTVQQNVQRNPTSLQVSSKQSVVRNAVPQQRPVRFNQTSINPKSVQGLQNFVEKISQPHNVPQNDTPMSNVNQSQSSRPSNVRKRKLTAHQKTSHTANQLVSNRNVAESIHRQQQVPNPPANANQAGKYMCVPTVNEYVDQLNVAHNVVMPDMNTFYGASTASTTNYSITQNMNPVYTIQQQNVNLPYNMQLQNINSTFQSQNIHSVNQQFPKTVPQPPMYNVAYRPPQMHGALLSSQNTPVVNYPLTQVFGTNSQQPMLRNLLQNEQMYQKVQMQPSPHAQNFIKPTTITKNQDFYSEDHATKTRNIPQVSLASTAKHFNILKYLSDIQKIMLLKQINFYFGCTTWLEQKFTQVKWQKVQFERTMLLNFHTLLKHLVDKVLYDLSQNKYQSVGAKSPTIHNVNIDAPKEAQITVEGYRTHCSIDVSHGKKVQSNLTTCAPQQNLNGAIVQNHSERGPEVADTPENTECTGKTQKSENTVCEQKDERTVQKNNCLRSVSLLETVTVLKDTDNSESAVRRNSQDSTKKQHSNEPEKVPENNSNSIEEEALNLVESNKDKLLQLNPHLVTVLISPDNDHVTVVDFVKSPEVTEEVFKTSDSKITEDSECSQNEGLNLSAEDSKLEKLPEPVSKSSDTNSDSSQDTFIIEEEETCSTQIADVRSISIETFEEMGLGSCTSIVVEENIVEEEIKVCLCCSKLSTVVCSLCLEAKYCSKECSELHWPEHYKICKLV